MKIFTFIKTKFIAAKKWFLKSSLYVKIIIIAVITVVSWFSFQKIQTKGSTASQFQSAKVERGTIVFSISTSGRVLSANILNITTNSSGIVKNLFVKDGDFVTSGQKIAEVTLDLQGQQKNAQAWSSYLSAKNTLDSAQATAFSLQSDMLTKWKTYMDLAQSSTYQNSDGSAKNDARTLPQFFSPYDDWLATEAKYKNQQGVINQARASLSNAWLSYQLTSPIITAPSSGIIGNINIVEGVEIGSQSVSSATDQSANQRVAVIQNEANPIVSVNLTEIDVSKVKIGQKATVTIDSLPDKTFTGIIVTVDRIGTISNNVTSYPANIKLDSSNLEILPNMAASANILLDTKTDVLMVPQAAIQTQAEQKVVRILKNGREEQVVVERGLTDDTKTEVISGLSEGDEVITGTKASSTTTVPQSTSVFGGGFGGGALRPGGAGGGQRR